MMSERSKSIAKFSWQAGSSDRLIRIFGRFPQRARGRHRYGRVRPDGSGTLPLAAEMGWRRTVATIRMQLQVFVQVFAMDCQWIVWAHDVSRLGQHSYPPGRGS